MNTKIASPDAAGGRAVDGRAVNGRAVNGRAVNDAAPAAARVYSSAQLLALLAQERHRVAEDYSERSYQYDLWMHQDPDFDSDQRFLRSVGDQDARWLDESRIDLAQANLKTPGLAIPVGQQLPISEAICEQLGLHLPNTRELDPEETLLRLDADALRAFRQRTAFAASVDWEPTPEIARYEAAIETIRQARALVSRPRDVRELLTVQIVNDRPRSRDTLPTAARAQALLDAYGQQQERDRNTTPAHTDHGPRRADVLPFTQRDSTRRYPMPTRDDVREALTTATALDRESLIMPARSQRAWYEALLGQSQEQDGLTAAAAAAAYRHANALGILGVFDTKRETLKADGVTIVPVSDLRLGDGFIGTPHANAAAWIADLVVTNTSVPFVWARSLAINAVAERESTRERLAPAGGALDPAKREATIHTLLDPAAYTPDEIATHGIWELQTDIGTLCEELDPSRTAEQWQETITKRVSELRNARSHAVTREANRDFQQRSARTI